jgi:hypothetical protein
MAAWVNVNVLISGVLEKGHRSPYISLHNFHLILQIYRVSVAAAPMAAWVKANVQFSVVLEKVKPLEDDLAGLQASLDASRARVKQCENDLASLDGTVSGLKEEFARRTGEAEALKIGLQQVGGKLKACMEVLSVSFGDDNKHLLRACKRLLRVRFF